MMNRVMPCFLSLFSPEPLPGALLPELWQPSDPQTTVLGTGRKSVT